MQIRDEGSDLMSNGVGRPDRRDLSISMRCCAEDKE
jgi:hypothetical protein